MPRRRLLAGARAERGDGHRLPTQAPMLVRYVLLTFPIHRRSFAEYYREHDEEMVGRRAELEREWGGQSFDDLPAHIRLAWKDRWHWPPWYFNDRIGYLKIGSDGDSSLLADVYLERRFF